MYITQNTRSARSDATVVMVVASLLLAAVVWALSRLLSR
jgi:hypothetical protein